MHPIDGFIVAAALCAVVSASHGQASAAPDDAQFVVKATFTITSPYGDRPYALMRGSDGNFYGTTSEGGAGGQGTAYRMNAKGAITTLYPFGLAENDPESVWDALIQANDGFFYGVGRVGGVNNKGAVFRLSRKGAFKLMHSFASGEAPRGRLVQASDGNLYGVSETGGTGANGFVYRLSLKGKYAVLVSFGSAATAGHGFQEGLTQAGDGNLYSVALLQGPSNAGTIYRVSLAGEFMLVHAFAGTDGGFPQGGLTLGPDGALYGTASGGGLNRGGTLFKIDTSGNYTKLVDFGSPQSDLPSVPFGSLTLGSDGNWYGVTGNGGAPGHPASGAVYRATTAGVVTSLHAFANGADGEHPANGPVEGPNLSFMGVDSMGGGTNTVGVAYSVK